MQKNRWTKDSTASEVVEGIDLRGKLAVVTGASSGIGKETARALGSAGASVFLGARTQTALDEVQSELEAVGTEAYTCPLDLMDPASVEAFAKSVQSLNRPLHILVNNAGIMASPRAENVLGIESQLATNYLGHALLVSLLAPQMIAAEKSRLVSLTSVAHQLSPVDLDDLNFQNKEYDKWVAYGQSKTACALLAVHVANELADRGVTAHAVHPGFIDTNLGRFLDEEEVKQAVDDVEELSSEAALFKSVESGAATSVWAATGPELEGLAPLYLEDCSVAEKIDTPNTNSGVMGYALDAEIARKLWVEAEKLLGRKLPL